MKMPNTYNIGDLVTIVGEPGWFRIIYINVYVEKDEDTGEIYADLYYGVENVQNGFFIEIHEYEVVNVMDNEVTAEPLLVATTPQWLPKFTISREINLGSITVPAEDPKKPTVNDLLDQLIVVKELNAVTNNAFAGKEEEILEKLRKLTSKEGD